MNKHSTLKNKTFWQITWLICACVECSSAARASCHVQERLNNLNLKHTILLPQVQHTHNFTLQRNIWKQGNWWSSSCQNPSNPTFVLFITTTTVSRVFWLISISEFPFLPCPLLDKGRGFQKFLWCFWWTLGQTHPCPLQTGVWTAWRWNPPHRGLLPCIQAYTVERREGEHRRRKQIWICSCLQKRNYVMNEFRWVCLTFLINFSTIWTTCL